MLMWHKNSDFSATPYFLSVFYCLPLIYELNPLELRCSNFYLLLFSSSLWNISIFLCITEVDEGGEELSVKCWLATILTSCVSADFLLFCFSLSSCCLCFHSFYLFFFPLKILTINALSSWELPRVWQIFCYKLQVYWCCKMLWSL